MATGPVREDFEDEPVLDERRTNMAQGRLAVQVTFCFDTSQLTLDTMLKL
eukprot:m.356862 g.356862  ORF g.356862 m.356862 type:complete len:50 (-) comp17639_c0_seq1:260-409(-)